jgi:hypothetical protein
MLLKSDRLNVDAYQCRSVTVRLLGITGIHILVPNMYTGFWRGNLREGEHLEDPCADGRIILK